MAKTVTAGAGRGPPHTAPPRAGGPQPGPGGRRCAERRCRGSRFQPSPAGLGRAGRRERRRFSFPAGPAVRGGRLAPGRYGRGGESPEDPEEPLEENHVRGLRAELGRALALWEALVTAGGGRDGVGGERGRWPGPARPGPVSTGLQQPPASPRGEGTAAVLASGARAAAPSAPLPPGGW